jgi:hypothetical protein
MTSLEKEVIIRFKSLKEGNKNLLVIKVIGKEDPSLQKKAHVSDTFHRNISLFFFYLYHMSL